MCGILGGNRNDWNYETGILSMKHRGPDGQRIVKFNEFTMAFARLSIIDLSEGGMQPMFSEDEQVCIVFNGEIYSYNILKDKLTEKGYRFHSKTDTEVLLNAYLEYGENFVDYIDGMFAVAIYDRRTQQVKLYRDRFGIKPLYYYFDGKNFCFSSELKGIQSMCQNIALKVDREALYDYLIYTYIPEPKSIYKNVFKLEPAHRLVFDIQKKQICKNERYWNLKINSARGSQRLGSDITDKVRELIQKSVKEQLVADVTVGSFLSGGIDSSIVSTESFLVNSKLEAFTMGFLYDKYDETEYAKILTDQYGIYLNKYILSKSDMKDFKSQFAMWYDEPYADTSGFPTYMISKQAKKKVTVILSGDGGDEVFGGYERYLIGKELLQSKGINCKTISQIYSKQFVKNININVKRKLDDLLLDDIAKYAKPLGCWNYQNRKAYAKKLGISKDYDDYWYLRKFDNKELPYITRLQNIDLNTYLPSDILTKVDRASMQASLEVRVPFLNKELVEYCFSLSEEDRCPNGELKGVLKKAYAAIIPEEILYRKKMGFSIPKQYLGKRKMRQFLLYDEIWSNIFD